jgi:4-hydroxybenzoate polyprenyltransferase
MNGLRTSGEYARLMIAVCVIFGLGCASAVLPWLEVLVGQVLVVLAVTGLLLAAIWWVRRWLRECREDRADIAHVNAVLTARALAEQSRTDDLPIGGHR